MQRNGIPSLVWACGRLKLIVSLLACGAMLAAALGWATHKGQKIPFLVQKDRWAIGIYEGEYPLALLPASGIEQPVLTADHVTDVPAEFVADPFLLHDGPEWYLFFEVLNRATGQGDIGLATSRDGRRWEYRQIVLDEPFHLSYPYVFRWQEDYYLIPESQADRSVRLYRAKGFPTDWEFVGTLLEGEKFTDNCIFRRNDRWWLFTSPRSHLRLFHAERLSGPWTEHPLSPLLRGIPHASRPAGRVIEVENRLIRFSQDGLPWYGSRVHAFEIVELTPTHYRERMIATSVLSGSGEGWNRDGMHHIDPHPVDGDRWLASVDGFYKHWAVRFGR